MAELLAEQFVFITGSVLIGVILFIIDHKYFRGRGGESIREAFLRSPQELGLISNAVSADAAPPTDKTAARSTFGYVAILIVGASTGFASVFVPISLLTIDADSTLRVGLLVYAGLTSAIIGGAAALAVDIRCGLDLSAAFWQRLLLAIIIGILAGWLGSIFFCIILIVVAIILFILFDKPTGVQFPNKE